MSASARTKSASSATSPWASSPMAFATSSGLPSGSACDSTADQEGGPGPSRRPAARPALAAAVVDGVGWRCSGRPHGPGSLLAPAGVRHAQSTPAHDDATMAAAPRCAERPGPRTEPGIRLSGRRSGPSPALATRQRIEIGHLARHHVDGRIQVHVSVPAAESRIPGPLGSPKAPPLVGAEGGTSDPCQTWPQFAPAATSAAGASATRHLTVPNGIPSIEPISS